MEMLPFSRQIFTTALQRQSQHLQPASLGRQAISANLQQPLAQMMQTFYNFTAVGNDKFSRGRRGRSPDIRRKISNRKVNLVTHGTDQRNFTGRNRVSNPFIIKRHKIFIGAAAPGQDYRIYPPTPVTVDQFQSRNYLAGRPLSLNRYRHYNNLNSGETTPDNLQNILHCGPGSRGYKGETARQLRQNLFAPGLKQSFTLKFLLQLGKSPPELTHTLKFQG